MRGETRGVVYEGQFLLPLHSASSLEQEGLTFCVCKEVK